MSTEQNRTPEPAGTPQAPQADKAEMEAAVGGPHAPASPYPKSDKPPETGGYEAPPRPQGSKA